MNDEGWVVIEERRIDWAACWINVEEAGPMTMYDCGRLASINEIQAGRRAAGTEPDARRATTSNAAAP